MKEMLIMLAKLMDENQVIKSLEEHINEYKEATLLGKNLEEPKKRLLVYCQIYLINSMPGDPMEIIKKINESDKINNLFQKSEN